MLKIYALDYYRLSNGEHCALMDFVKKSFEEFPVVPETFPKAVELFLAALKQEHRALQHVDRPLQSAAIQKADAERVRCFRRLRDWAKLMLTDGDAAIVEAARAIVRVSDAIGGSKIASQPVEARTGGLTIFIQRLETDFHNDVVTLGLQPLLGQLKEANQRFWQARLERNGSDAEYGRNATKRARKQCDFTLKTVFSLVQDHIRLGEGDEFEDFVRLVNVEIDTYRIALGQGRSSASRRPTRRSKSVGLSL